MEAFPGQIGSADFGRGAAGWASAVALLALLSMIIGNLLAIAQKNVRRLLAYSAIAHAGYALLAVVSNSGSGLTSLAYYMITYGLAVIGAFAVIGLVETRHGEVKLADLSGLYKRSPLAALCLMIFILSLAGIPPLAGFFGKFYVFVALLNSSGKSLGTMWLVIAAVATSAVSLYYYLQILKFAFVKDSQAGQGMITPAGSTKFVMGTLAALVVLLGVLPNLLVAPLATAAKVPLPARTPSAQFHTYAK
jgi:NADH-quinone oxidoreductase subunit N